MLKSFSPEDEGFLPRKKLRISGDSYTENQGNTDFSTPAKLGQSIEPHEVFWKVWKFGEFFNYLNNESVISLARTQPYIFF